MSRRFLLVSCLSLTLVGAPVLLTAPASGGSTTEGARVQVDTVATSPAEAKHGSANENAIKRAKAHWTEKNMRRAEPLRMTSIASPLGGEPVLPDVSTPTLPPPTLPKRHVEPAAQEPAISTERAISPTEGYWQGSTKKQPAYPIGKLFYQQRIDGVWRNKVCSGAVVNSENKSVVWTAGHCVYDTVSKLWVRYPKFCPAYNRVNGCRVAGAWYGKNWNTTGHWAATDACFYRRDAQGAVVGTSCQDYGYDADLGVILIKERSATPRRIANAVGAHALGVNYTALRADRYTYGYPGNKDNGQSLYYCFAYNSLTDRNHLRIPCTSGGGSSGGPWISSFNANFGGTVVSVNSHGGRKFMEGPYQGQAALDLFNWARYTSPA